MVFYATKVCGVCGELIQIRVSMRRTYIKNPLFSQKRGFKIYNNIIIKEIGVFRRYGGYLLSRALRQSTIGVKGFNDRVRDGIGWDTFAMTTISSKHSLEIRLQITFEDYLYAKKSSQSNY